MSTKVEAWRDSRGSLHLTKTLAEQSDAFLHLMNEYQGLLEMFPKPDADQIVNSLYANKNAVRNYLDLTDQMMKEAGAS